MKKTLSVIVAGLVILVVLFSIPSNALERSDVIDSKSQYASIPPFDNPPKPPKK
jgi:hypothetical protein